MRKVILESPYAGNVEANLEYARNCLKHSIQQKEAPIASHLLYTQVLDDNILEERELGIKLGQAWMMDADAIVVYTDLGISPGMRRCINRASYFNLPVIYRSLLEEKD